MSTYPLLDDSGTPMSPAVNIVERYTLSENDTRLDLVIDGPPIRRTWLNPRSGWRDGTWEPGVRIRPFECTVRE